MKQLVAYELSHAWLDQCKNLQLRRLTHARVHARAMPCRTWEPPRRPSTWIRGLSTNLRRRRCCRRTERLEVKTDFAISRSDLMKLFCVANFGHI